MNATPRTDAQAGWVLDSTPVHAQGFEQDPDGSYVPADFARKLERELMEVTQRANRTMRAYLCNQDIPEADAEAEANRVYPLANTQSSATPNHGH